MPARKTSSTPMPRAWTTLTLVLGPMSVGVGIKRAVAPEAIHQTTLCPCHHLPIKQAVTCQIDGGIVEPIKRYEHGDTWVELDPTAFEVPKDYTITLNAAPRDVELVYVEKPFLIWPRTGYESQFDMLAEAVRRSGRTLIGTAVLGKQTRVLALRWSGAWGLLAYQLAYDEDVCQSDVALIQDAAAARPEPAEEYVDLLVQLIERTMPDTWDPADYTNDYRESIREAIAAAANGTPIVRMKTPEPVEAVPDLMAALRETIAVTDFAQAKSTTRKPAAKKPAAAKKASSRKTTTARKAGRRKAA